MVERWRQILVSGATIDRPWRFAFIVATPIAVVLFPCLWLISRWSALNAAIACAVSLVVVGLYTRFIEVPRQRRQRDRAS